MLKLSPIIIGTMRWGSWGANLSEKGVQNLIEVCVEDGLSTFDHADIYGNYTTEKLFGKAFREMRLEREKIQLISKCGIQLPGGTATYKIKSYNYSKEYIIKSVDSSLKNLQTDYLDLFLLHRPSPLMNSEEIAEAFHILKEGGKVQAFGVSNFSMSQFDLLNQYFPLETNQIEVSLNNTSAFYDGTLDQLLQNKRRPLAYSVLGNYFTENSAENIRIKKILNTLCENYNAEENQILLAFLLKHPAGILPIIGTSRAEMIKILKKSLFLNLDVQDWFQLLEAKNGKEVD
ncbi:aldo/keto reductase [Chryseobacterium sp. MP_3.2]|uniref:aldo/keto reductase n=1 Tax=Chryseobacterium sp. MP_3.2 TaxID=3071712 RepID=UPI002E031162|nr:putative oxidoreductase [Chryseobacterium sp. MP_3.2]